MGQEQRKIRTRDSSQGQIVERPSASEMASRCFVWPSRKSHVSSRKRARPRRSSFARVSPDPKLLQICRQVRGHRATPGSQHGYGAEPRSVGRTAGLEVHDRGVVGGRTPEASLRVGPETHRPTGGVVVGRRLRTGRHPDRSAPAGRSISTR